MSSLLRRAALGALLWGLTGLPVVAVDGPPVGDAAAIQRIFVPADQPESWPIGETRYLPITRQRWEALQQSAAEQSAEASGPPPQFQHADYTLRFAAPDLLTGEATLSIRLRREAATVVPLSPFSPRLTQMTAGDPPQPVSVGSWTSVADEAASPPQGQLGVLLQRSGKVHFQFEQRSAATSGGYRFRLRLPPAIQQTLTLYAAKELAVELDGAILESRTQKDDHLVVRTYLLGPGGERELRVTSPQPQPDTQQPGLRYSQEESYRLAPHGLDYETTLTLRPVSHPPTDILLDVSDSLKLLQASIDGRPAPWSSEGGGAALRIALPRSNQPITVALRGAAPVYRDQAWELPKVRLRDAAWSEGAARLWVDPRLELTALTPSDANLESLLGVGPLGAGAASSPGELYRLQYFSSQSGVVVAAARPQQPLAIRALTQVVLDDVVENLQTTLLLEGQRPHDFHAQLPLAAGWQVEAVDSAPSGEVLHWRVVDQDARRLEVQFRSAPTEAAPLVLKIAGRRDQRALDLPVQASDLAWLDFSKFRVLQNLIWLTGRQADDRIVAASSAADEALLSDATARFFGVAAPASSTVAIDLETSSPETSIALQRREPTYQAESIVACAAADQLVYQVALRCRPLQGALRDLPVVFSRPLPAGAQWSLGDDAAAPAATPLEAPAIDSLDQDQQPAVYRVYLPEPAKDPFTLTVTYRRPIETVHALDGVALPDAQRSNGWAVLLGAADQVEVDGRACSPAPMPGRSAAALSRLPAGLPVLAAFRFDEDFPLRLSLAPQLILRPPTGATDRPEGIVCRWVDRISVHAADGRVRCRASYLLTPGEATSVAIRFAHAVDGFRALVDDAPASLSEATSTAGIYRVLLPSQQQMVRLSIEFLAEGPPLDEQSRLYDPWPDVSFTPPRGRWTVWTPPRFSVELDNAGRMPWLRRLFGPLARSGRQRPFSPWQPLTWPMPGRGDPDLQQTRQTAVQLLARLDERLQTTPQSGLLEILQAAIAAMPDPGQFRMDAAALATLGQESVRQKFPVALVLLPEMIAVTSPAKVSFWSRHVRRTSDDRVVAARSDVPWEIRRGDELTPAAAWAASLQADATPVARSTWAPLEMEGWNAERFVVVGDAPTPALIVLPRRQGLWKACWLLAAALGVWLARIMPRQLGLLVFLSGLACLVAPRAWLLAPQAAFVGLSAGWLFATVYRWLPGRAAAAAHATTLTAAIALILGMAGAAARAEPGLGLPQVLIPIDDQGEITGDEVYAPADLVLQLQRQAEADPYDRRPAVITGGRWQLTLPDERAGDGKAGRSAVSLSGESFRPDARLTLPLKVDDAVWYDRSHTLNGAPVEVEWLAGGGCIVPLAAPGKFQLMLYFRPRVEQVGTRSQASLTIPKLPASELALTGASEVDDLVIDDAVEQTHDPVSGVATALIASTRQLAVSWMPRTPVSRRVRVEQLHWLSIDPAASRSEALIRLSGPGAAPQEVVLELSNNLSLLPSVDDQESPPIATPSVEQDRVVLRLPAGTQLPLEIPLAFQLKRTVSIGRIEMPRIRVVGMEEVRSWFAASIDSQLNYEESVAADLRRVPANEFADRWGASERPPATAWAAGDDPSAWSIRVWPRRTPLVAEQTLRVWCQRDAVAVDYRATIPGQTRDRFIYRFDVPPDFVLLDATVTTAEQQTRVPIRWSRSAPDEATVFLSRPLREVHQIVLSGRQPVAAEQTFPLPRFALQDAELKPLQLLLDRDRQIEVTLTGGRADPIEASADPPSPRYARVGAYRLNASALESAALTVAPNRMEASAQTAICVTPSTRPIEVEMLVAVRVERGVLDVLTIQAPPEFTRPQIVGSNVAAAVRTLNDEPGQQIECFLGRPIGAGEQRLVRIRGRLVSAADRRIRVPELRLAKIRETARYVILPTNLEDRSLYWVWDNLHSERLPPELAEAAPLRGVAFRVTGEHYSAEQQIQPESIRKVSIRAAEVTVAIDPAGNAAATCRYVLQPGSVEHCLLRMPAGAELLSLEAGGRPVPLAPGDGPAWTAPLSPPLMPIEIVARYRQQLAWTTAGFSLEPPRLIIAGRPVPTPPFRWEIFPAEGLTLIGPENGQPIDRERFVRETRQARQEVVQQTSLLALQLPAWEAEQWYEQWRAWMGAPAGPPASDPDAQPRAAATSRSPWEVLEERFEKVPRPRSARTGSPDASADDPAAYVITNRPALALRVDREASRWQRWLIAVAGIALLIGGRRRPAWTARGGELAGRYPEAAALLLGLAWWAWLSPSIVGAGVAATACLVLLGRTATRRRPSDGAVADDSHLDRL